MYLKEFTNGTNIRHYGNADNNIYSKRKEKTIIFTVLSFSYKITQQGLKWTGHEGCKQRKRHYSFWL
jgi:uncharacterized protein YjhX (UPF0386 family)